MEPLARDIFDRSQPGPETTAKEEQHRLFACIVLVRVLSKCNALQSCTKDEHATHTKVLLDQIMEGLSFPKSIDMSKNVVKRISRAVLSDLQKVLTAEKLKNNYHTRSCCGQNNCEGFSVLYERNPRADCKEAKGFLAWWCLQIPNCCCCIYLCHSFGGIPHLITERNSCRWKFTTHLR